MAISSRQHFVLSDPIINVAMISQCNISLQRVNMDLSKAFDTILCQKLAKYGINCLILKWFESYLHDRKQQVHCNNNDLTFEDIRATHAFIENYASTHALVLPGRVPGYKRNDVSLLPSSHTKVIVYGVYKKCMEESNDRAISLTSFKRIWRQLLPNIVTCKPMTDLCATCQQNNYLIYRSANLAEEDKCEKLQKQESHLMQVHEERSLYQQMCDQAKAVCKAEGIDALQESAACSHRMTMHYSFDYAQQVHLPSNPLQPGSIFFLVPRKTGLFGVCCEGLPRQVNFLIDEAHLISKGSNAVVSFLHHFFERYGLGETDVHLHCDNCSGQNKNKFVQWYLAWRVAVTSTSPSLSISWLLDTQSFLPTGVLASSSRHSDAT
ncbi:hypothetical protein CAPTEDRAFT_191102 [Capitella teleta]|uniref:Reverse transcriptase domain-containing protein n=1 Tax=Capitella teleta TaxID=283909 RepID=R7UVF8_CAPTE|nr:hypothetical protein CAPTEDRAFT_191102 [Capitella teleta]|eukprot:ELU10608.1 hypothetical protein CAPTEDRAFT_191102 [Capitella teleta]